MSVRFTDNPLEADAITHTGTFHADDVFCIVFLEKLLGDVVVYRSMPDLPQQLRSDAIIFDIGDGEFDHHQRLHRKFHKLPYNSLDKQAIPFAAFGLLWKRFGFNFCQKLVKNSQVAHKLYKDFERNLVISIDATDNGYYPTAPSDWHYFQTIGANNIISILNPNGSEEKNYEPWLYKALDFARLIFDVVLKSELSTNDTANWELKCEEIFANVLLENLPPEAVNDELKDVCEYHPFKTRWITVKKPIPLSRFGKLWQKYGKALAKSYYYDEKYPDYIWEFIQTHLVIGIDAGAFGIHPVSRNNLMSYSISTLPRFFEIWSKTINSEAEYLAAKETALSLARLIYERDIAKAVYRICSRIPVEQEIETSLNQKNIFSGSSKHILILKDHLHWNEWVSLNEKASDLWFVISPSDKGGFVIQPIPSKYNLNGYRKGFPSSWYGLKGKELQRITKVSTATFIHPEKGFIGGASDLEGAILLAKNAFPNPECAHREY